jgi:hypothetical protein
MGPCGPGHVLYQPGIVAATRVGFADESPLYKVGYCVLSLLQEGEF